MDIKIIEDANPMVFALIGRLDTNTSPQLEKFALDQYEQGHIDLVVDMAKCEFVSSAGLRVIVAMQKRATVNGSLVFKNVVSDVMDVFNMTGFNRILTIE